MIMDNKETLNNDRNTEKTGFDEIADEAKKTSWLDHVSRAKSLIKGKLSGESSEKPKNSELYLLSERVVPPADASRKEKKKFKEVWGDIFKNWDNCGIDVPLEVGQLAAKYVNDPNYQFGIHHSWAINGRNYETDGVLREILEEGLMNMGDSSSGRVYTDPPVSKTVNMCPSEFLAIAQMKSSYKGSTGALLVAIPSEYVERDGSVKPGMEDKVYDHNSANTSFIKPEFILGFVQNLGKGTKLEYKSREDLLKGYKEADAKEDKE